MNNMKTSGADRLPPHVLASQSNLALRGELMRHRALQRARLHKMQGVKPTL